MKHRTVIFAVAVLALAAVAVFASAGQVNSQEPTPAQPGTPAIVAAAQSPAAPTSLIFSYQGQLLDAAGAPITNQAVPMTFRLYPAASGGTACWSENRTVDVRNGLFNALLGQTAAINSECLSSDAYLELIVNGETLAPRERLTSVSHAVEASTLPSGAVTRGSIAVNGNIDLLGNEIGNVRSLRGPTGSHVDLMYGQSEDMFIKSNASGNLYVGMGGNVTLGVSGNVHTGGDTNVGGYNLRLGAADDAHTALRRDGRILHLLPWGGSAYVWDKVCIGCGSTADLMVNGNLDLRGSCTRASTSTGAKGNVPVADEDCAAGSIMSGAYVEANLLTPKERGSDTIDRFEQGDLLCWSATSEQLERCSTANDRLVMAVADPDGRPIVIGAEPIKVLGPVQAGDILVSSDLPGYARVNNEPKPGTVIGQSLEGFDGEMGLVKAMIRKW